MPNEIRVVVTGMGLITPLGIGLEENWSAVIAGKSGVGKITRFNPERLSSHVGGEVKGFNPEDYIERKEIKKMDKRQILCQNWQQRLDI